MIVDAIIIAFVGFFTWRGLRRGLVRSLTGLLGFAAATVAAVFGFRVLARPLQGAGLSEGVANLAGALLIFLSITVGVAVLGRVLTRALRWTKFGFVNTAGGAVLSAGWAVSWVTAVLLAITSIPAPRAIAGPVEDSTIAKGLVREAPRWARSVAHTDLRRALTFFVPDQRTVALVATEDFHRVPEAERALFDRVDDERRSQGRAELVWDESLAVAARRHAADMYRRGFFGHRTPEGVGERRRLLRARVTFRVAGENLALAPSVALGHAWLMASDVHRSHIVAARFDRIGIGVMYGRQGYLIVEEFAGD